MEGSKNKIRLIRKTSKSFLWISLVLMLVSTVILYFYVKTLLQKEIEEELRSTEARVESALSNNIPIYQLLPILEIEKVPTLGIEKLKDTIIFDPSQDEMEEFRELTTYSYINGINYRISVRTLIVESEDILIAVVISYLIIIIVVFIFLFYFNKAYNEKLWLPFFNNLEQMKRFSLSSEKPIQLTDSDILEFTELNKEISTLTDKVRADYKNLKQYTEDVSHELQTPLAIIQAKIENIINGNNLNSEQYEHLTSIQKDINRLTQMNKRLTLLTKIENQQFVNPLTVNINKVIQKRIDNFKEFFPVEIEFMAEQSLEVKMDPYLADVLCDNLISNALKHNTGNGTIKVRINDLILTITNAGTKELQRPELLFTRFYRESNQEKSTGLGLAIVQKICDLYDFKTSYSFSNQKHFFKVNFN
ncbi:MAG: HAMP domain-containing sensor histidine kinase [Maribacter sp.]